MYYVVTYTRTHAPQVPVLLARRGPNLTCARQPAPARCSNNPEASIHGMGRWRCIGLARPSVRPSVGGVPPLMAQKMRQHTGHGALELHPG